MFEKLLHDPASGHVSEPPHVGKYVTFGTDSASIYVLHNSHIVVKINGTTEDIIWTWSAPDQTCVVFLSTFRHDIDIETTAPLRYTRMSLQLLTRLMLSACQNHSRIIHSTSLLSIPPPVLSWARDLFRPPSRTLALTSLFPLRYLPPRFHTSYGWKMD